MEPLVSVIIPVYNVAQLLREAIDSVIRQSYRNLEILLIDDGSTDGSGEICDQYLADGRVTVIHQENRGLSGARNTGLDAMTGAYTAFLDSDDAFEPDMIRTMVSALQEQGADLAVCGFHTVRTEKELLPRAARSRRGCRYPKETISGQEGLRRIFFGGMNYAVWNKVTRRELWDGIRFTEGQVYEDVHVMYPLMAKCSRIQLLPEMLAAYRIRKGSITQTVSSRNISDYLDAQRMRAAQMAGSIPERFSEADQRRFADVQLRGMIRQYAQWRCSHPDRESREALEALRREIRQREESTDRLSLKTRIMALAGRTVPQAIPLLSFVYHALRRTAGR